MLICSDHSACSPHLSDTSTQACEEVRAQAGGPELAVHCQVVHSITCRSMRPSLHSHQAHAARCGDMLTACQRASEQQSKMPLMPCRCQSMGPNVQECVKVRPFSPSMCAEAAGAPTSAAPGRKPRSGRRRWQRHSFKLPLPPLCTRMCTVPLPLPPLLPKRVVHCWAGRRACALTPACGPPPK